MQTSNTRVKMVPMQPEKHIADDEVVKCLLCSVPGEKRDLFYHIASEEFDYHPHQCRTCKRSYVYMKEAFEHAVGTGHYVMLNDKLERYKQELIEKSYNDSIIAHLKEKKMIKEEPQESSSQESRRPEPQASPDNKDNEPPRKMSKVSMESMAHVSEERHKHEMQAENHSSAIPQRHKEEDREGSEPGKEVSTVRKRPRNAYDIWRSENSERLKKEAKAQGKFHHTFVSEQWRTMKDKSEWEGKAAAERENLFKRGSLEPEEKGVSTRRKRMSAFDLWRNENRERLTRDANAQHKLINSYASEQWKAVKDKSEWETKAADERLKRLKRESLEAEQQHAQVKAESLDKHDSKPVRL